MSINDFMTPCTAGTRTPQKRNSSRSPQWSWQSSPRSRPRWRSSSVNWPHASRHSRRPDHQQPGPVLGHLSDPQRYDLSVARIGQTPVRGPVLLPAREQGLAACGFRYNSGTSCARTPPASRWRCCVESVRRALEPIRHLRRSDRVGKFSERGRDPTMRTGVRVPEMHSH